ncbi:MAG: glycoside hydrolase [Euryarchaeota archaeon]|nr:glycoside hydrolase [Euryarchaeota archaeon]
MRAALFALSLLGLVLSGCVADETDPEPQAPEPELETPFVDIRGLIDAERGMGEPSVGVTPEGLLFTSTNRGVYKSADLGRNWTFVGNPMTTFNADPDLVVDADGTVWYDTLYLACNEVAVSRDHGDTWNTHPAVCNGPIGDRQYIVATGGGTAYLYYHQIPTFYQTAMKTTDHGETWLPTGPVETPDHHLLVDEGSGWGGGGFHNAAAGSVFFTFTWFSDGPAGPGGWAPAFSVTRDGGASFEVVVVAEPEGDPLGLSLVVGSADDAGNVYIAWGELLEDETVAIRMAVSTDDGRTFGEPVRLDDGNGSNVFPAIEAGAPGHVAVAYYAADQDGHPGRLPNNATWKVELVNTTDVTNATPTFTTTDISAGPVKLGAICPNGASCQANRQFLDYFDLVRMPDGRLGAMYNTRTLPDHENETRNVFALTSGDLLGAWPPSNSNATDDPAMRAKTKAPLPFPPVRP